jgi:energy-coupling factor transporter ATP-binding protein EcfA2
MRFRNQGDELVYCSPAPELVSQLDVIAHAARVKVDLLDPMSGLETEEPLLQPGRIDVLLGQGQTAQVLRNLCLMVERQSSQDWARIASLMKRLFHVELSAPRETSRGSVELQYRQPGVKEMLDVSSAGRGFHQMLLIFAHLYAHKGSVLLVDEPDAHLEILRQKQVYVLLRDIAADNGSQVVMVTHSEVILDEAVDSNLTLLMDGQADDLARRQDIKNSLKHFGAAHYVKARERGYVLYVEGSTDVDLLRAMATHLGHRAAEVWDERINTFYVQNNYPQQDADAELARVEGGFGVTPFQHFQSLRTLVPGLEGLAILDNDGRDRGTLQAGDLTVVHWRRYEVENYVVTPDVLRRYALAQYADMDLFDGHAPDIEAVLDDLILNTVFDAVVPDFQAWKGADSDVARVLWEAKTEHRKLSTFAEAFFRQLAQRLGGPMLLTKGSLHRLVPMVDPLLLPAEVNDMLDRLATLFTNARPAEGVAEPDEGEEGSTP